MTGTTTEPKRRRPGHDHDRPCFCEVCIAIMLWDLARRAGQAAAGRIR